MSTRRTAAIALLILSPFLAACGADTPVATNATTIANPATTGAPSAGGSGGGGMAGALAAAAAGIDDASSVSCDANRQTLETAMLAFRTVNGSDPTTQDDLVGQFIVAIVPGFEIAADGTVQPLADGPCAGH